MSRGIQIDTRLRVHLAHAAVQAIADEAGVDILAVKGPALDGSLRPQATFETFDGRKVIRPEIRSSTDADVLVRPSHVDTFVDALLRHGWTFKTRFSTGSAFEHAASMWHDKLGYVDVHRIFPGIGLDSTLAFERLWSDHGIKEIAHTSCTVPSLDGQRLILLLHAARGGSRGDHDVELLWTNASPGERARTLALADELHAQVALAAATGRLDEFADDPTADLWRVFATGAEPTRLQEWRARFRAAPTPAAKARIVVRSFIVNTDHLEMELGRPLIRSEVVRAYAERPVKAAVELGQLASAYLRRRRA